MRHLLKKSAVVLKDVLRLEAEGAVRSVGTGIRMPDGSAVPVEHIMKSFGVSRKKAEEIASRRSQ